MLDELDIRVDLSVLEKRLGKRPKPFARSLLDEPLTLPAAPRSSKVNPGFEPVRKAVDALYDFGTEAEIKQKIRKVLEDFATRAQSNKKALALIRQQLPEMGDRIVSSVDLVSVQRKFFKLALNDESVRGNFPELSHQFKVQLSEAKRHPQQLIDTVQRALTHYETRASALPSYEMEHLRGVMELIDRKRQYCPSCDGALSQPPERAVEDSLSQQTIVRAQRKGPLSGERAKKFFYQAFVLDFLQREVILRNQILPNESLIRDNVQHAQR